MPCKFGEAAILKQDIVVEGVMVRIVLRWSVELGLKILDIDREEFVQVCKTIVLQDFVLQGSLSKDPFGLRHSCHR